MSEITISEETTAAGFWNWPGSTAELRIAALTSFRNSDAILVPAGNIQDPDTCMVKVTCMVNEDGSVPIPEISELFTTYDSIDNPNVKYIAGLFAEDGFNYVPWPNQRLSQGFHIQTDLAPTTTWRLIILSQGTGMANPPRTYATIPQIIQFILAYAGSLARATAVLFGLVRLSAPADDSSDPIAVGKNDRATTTNYGIVKTTTSNDIVVSTNDSRMTNSRAPTGGAGGVLSGSYPNPGFAVDMATQAELDAHANNVVTFHGITFGTTQLVNGTNTVSLPGKIQTTSIIIPAGQDSSVSGVPSVTARDVVAGSFTITSSNPVDSGTVGFVIFNPGAL